MSNALRIEIAYSVDGYIVRAERNWKLVETGIAIGPEDDTTLRNALRDLRDRLRAI